ncbi:MAG: hypothetical protein ACJA0N_000739 [Pseudohongiellaceae bacterium]|jgi:hypothetical protein
MPITGITVRIILTSLVILLTACSSNTPSENNTQAFPYRYNHDAASQKPIKKIILATQSFGRPPLAYLKNADRRVKRYVKEYLEGHGYQILPGYHFDNAWKQAVRSYGKYYDPSTGSIDNLTWQRIMLSTGQALKKQTDADAIIFADVIEHDVQHNGGMQHSARFNGVSRKPYLKGATTSVPLGFDWNQDVKAGSVLVNIYNIDLQRILTNYGGMSTTQALESKNGDAVWVRRKNVLMSENSIEEGIEIAFHPFIKMDDYPGEEQVYETQTKTDDTKSSNNNAEQTK